jgi:hypothetical protein
MLLAASEVVLYILPAVLTRYLFFKRQIGRFAAFGFCSVLFIFTFSLTIIIRSTAGEYWLGGSLLWVIIASFWSYSILRAKGTEGMLGALDNSSIKVKTEKSKKRETHEDEELYEKVALELENNIIKRGLWLKAETKVQGDSDKTRLLYIEWRVQQLAVSEREEKARLIREEDERQRENEARAKQVKNTCPKCNSPMEELKVGEWRCNECG